MQPESDRRGWNWTAGSVLRTAAIVLALAVAAVFAWKIRSILIVGFFGILFGILLATAAAKLTRFHIPQAVGAVLILLTFFGFLVGTGFLMAPLLQEQSRELQRRLPQLIERVEQRFGVDAVEIGEEIAEGVGIEGAAQQEGAGQQQMAQQPGRSAEGPPQRRGVRAAGAREGADGRFREMVTSNLGRIRDILFPVASAAVDAIAGLLIVVFVALFIAARPQLYKKGLLRIVPERSREEAADVFDDVGSSLLQWLVARLIAMVAVGLIVGISLAVMGVPGAAVLGVIAGLLEFIPFFGPIASSLPAIGMALLDSPQKALWVVVLFLIVQQIEGNVLTPLLLQNRVDVPPALTLLTVPALMIVFGLIGGLIAEPLLAVSIVLTRRLWVERHADRMNGRTGSRATATEH